MKDRHSGLTFALLVALPLLIVAGYMGSYFALLDRHSVQFGVHVTDGVLPVYRVDGALVNWIFWPAHQIDRHFLRPNLWEFDDWG